MQQLLEFRATFAFLKLKSTNFEYADQDAKCFPGQTLPQLRAWSAERPGCPPPSHHLPPGRHNLQEERHRQRNVHHSVGTGE